MLFLPSPILDGERSIRILRLPERLFLGYNLSDPNSFVGHHPLQCRNVLLGRAWMVVFGEFIVSIEGIVIEGAQAKLIIVAI